jgi:hypothetical protein
MVHRKSNVGHITKRVWRITPNAPHGEYVDPDQVPLELTRPPERPAPGWLASSFELTNGLDVSDETDTLPSELFDELFKTKM